MASDKGIFDVPLKIFTMRVRFRSSKIPPDRLGNDRTHSNNRQTRRKRNFGIGLPASPHPRRGKWLGTLRSHLGRKRLNPHWPDSAGGAPGDHDLGAWQRLMGGGLGVHWFLLEMVGGEQGSGRGGQSTTPPYMGETGGENWFGGRCLIERKLRKTVTLT